MPGGKFPNLPNAVTLKLEFEILMPKHEPVLAWDIDPSLGLTLDSPPSPCGHPLLNCTFDAKW